MKNKGKVLPRIFSLQLITANHLVLSDCSIHGPVLNLEEITAYRIFSYGKIFSWLKWLRKLWFGDFCNS